MRECKDIVQRTSRLVENSTLSTVLYM